jgi:hypothetical protein
MSLKFCAHAAIWTALSGALIGQSGHNGIPRLEKKGTTMQLVVDGKPFLILGGELQESTPSGLEYLKAVWPQMKALRFNTVLAATYWEMIEPEEGRFDFALVDGLISQARQNDMRLVLLWFGSWKNATSSYAPLWVKKDTARFPRVKDRAGQSLEMLSCLSEENRKADERAFAALMRHIRAIDGEEHTVLMMQVENEVGIKPDSRDRSTLADEAFAKPVPKELMDHLMKNRDTLHPALRKTWEDAGLRSSGTWAEVFGESRWADGIFQAWHYSRYLNSVAAAGKAEYPIPMYANAWLDDGGAAAGSFPSGGPVPRVIDIWRSGGSHLDMLSPDVYAVDFTGYIDQYARPWNPLFIPEARADARSGATGFYAIGKHHALGFSPFGVDLLPDPANQPLAANNAVLAQLAPLILRNRGTANLSGVAVWRDKPQEDLRMGGYTFTITHGGLRRPDPVALQQAPAQGYLLAINLGDDEYLLAGAAVAVTVASNHPVLPIAGIGFVDEGSFVDGQWVRSRRINGGQNDNGRMILFSSGTPRILRVKLYSYR